MYSRHIGLRDPLSDRFLIDHALRSFAASQANEIALVADGRRLTYAGLNELVDRCAALFREVGVRRGDRVVGVMDNGVDAVVTFYGALRADAVPSLLSPATRPRRVAQVVSLAEPRVLVMARNMLYGFSAVPGPRTDARPAAMYLCGAAPLTGQKVTLDAPDFGASIEAAPAKPPVRASIELDLASLCWTSGSTGDPKGVMLTHQNLRNSAAAIGAYLGHTQDDVVLCVLPLSHTYGLFQMLVTHTSGGTLVLEKGFVMPWPAVQRMVEEGVTGFAGVPTIFASLLSMKEIGKADLPSLRYMTNAANGLPEAQLMRLRALFPNVSFFTMYGQTECSRVCYLPPQGAVERPTSVGMAMPNEEFWIEREDGTCALPGEVGELVVRGPNVMRGYWRNPEATARVLRPGPIPGELVLYTGDMFKMDESGYLYFLSRRDGVIKTRGEKVSPTEVESVICKMSGVIEVAVFGVPDPVLGMAVKALVVRAPDSGVNADDIRRMVRTELEEIAVPKVVEFVLALPKTASGKLDRSELF